jgi:hypothetical protein
MYVLAVSPFGEGSGLVYLQQPSTTPVLHWQLCVSGSYCCLATRLRLTLLLKSLGVAGVGVRPRYRVL